MRGLLKTLAVVLVAVAVGLGITLAVHHRPGPGAPQAQGSTTTTTLRPDMVPAADQVFVTGTVASLTATNALGPALTPPFTVTIPVRGAGSADLTGVSVAGRPVEIYWYGGQPLPFGGTGQLVIGGGGLSVDPSGITWMLDGAARSLTTGHFFLGAPVAVGSSGLATSEQTESFDAGPQATMLTTGHAQIHQKPAALQITGPGSITMNGVLRLQTSEETRSVHSVVFGPGSYQVSLTPVAGGDTIDATLQGPVTSS